MERWKLCLKIIKEAPFFGHGTGDEIDMLKTEYKNHFYIKSYVESLNAHSQYLSILIKHGIIGFLFFIFCSVIIYQKHLRIEIVTISFF